jgi:hypothetical protein
MMNFREKLAPITENKYIRIFAIYFIFLVLLTKFDIQSSADASRIATVKSLVDDWSFTIDNTQFDRSQLFTVDKYFYNNHFYSDKPPLPALMGAVIYLFIKLFFGINFSNNLGLSYYLIVLLTVGVLSGIGLVYFHKVLLEIFKTEENWANVTTFLAATATLILPYSLVLNNHILGAVFIIISFYYLLKSAESTEKINIILCGIVISMAGSIDITCFLFIPFYLVFFLSRSLAMAIVFLVSCLPLIATYFSLNIYLSGSMVPPAMNVALWEYPGSIFSKQTLSGVATQKSFFGALRYSFTLYLGNRGFFSHTPIMFFSIMGILAFFRQKKKSYQIPYLCGIAASVAFMLLYTLKTVDYGGYSYGVRWFVTPMLLLFLPLSHAGNSVRSSRLLKNFFVVIACISIAISLVGTYNPYTNDSTGIASLLGSYSIRYTFLLNVKNIVYNSSEMYKLCLITSAVAIYFLFYRLLQKLKQNPTENQ